MLHERGHTQEDGTEELPAIEPIIINYSSRYYRTMSHFNDSVEPSHCIIIAPSKRPRSLGFSYGYLLAYLRLNLRMTTQLIEKPSNSARSRVVTCYDECSIQLYQLTEADEGGRSPR